MSIALGLLDDRIRREVLTGESPLAKEIRDGIAKKLAENHYRPRSFKDMTFAFTDKEGRAYYAWQNFAEIPPIREKNIEAVMLMIDRRVSDKEIAEISDDMQLLIQDKVIAGRTKEDKSEGAAKLMILAQELKYRSRDIIPEDLFYDLASYCVVREDENPSTTDKTIHLQKIKMFSEAGTSAASFFLTMPVWNDLLTASLTTEAGLLRLLPRWTRMRERRKMIMETVNTPLERKSAPTTTATTGSRSASPKIHPKAFKR